MKINRALSPSFISEFDENEEIEHERLTRRKKSQNKLLDQFNSTRNAKSPFLAQGKRNLVPNKFNRIPARMKSPMPGRNLPLIHNDGNASGNRTIMGMRQVKKGRNNGKNAISPLQGFGMTAMKQNNQFATINPPQRPVPNRKSLNFSYCV